MALVEGCKHEVEISVPVQEIEQETERVLNSLKKKVRIHGFRPGKVPPDLIRKQYARELEQEVLEKIIPKHFRMRVEAENLELVGSPNIKDVHFHPGEPLHFKAEFEVAPTFDLGEYRGLACTFREPVVTDEDIDKRLADIREQKAEFVSIDPRPAADGDYAVVSLRSIEGVEGAPIEQDELRLEIGGADTLPAFTENLRGAQPAEEKEFEVAYPAEYGEDRLAGKSVRFHVTLKSLQRKELPELNDEFARDLGDYQNLGELREEIRKGIFREREFLTQQEAKEQLVDKLVEAHDFPVPETYIERQIENHVEQYLRGMAHRGVDPRSVKLDWEKIKESQRDKAVHDVKAALVLDKISEREAIETTVEELDREVQRIAKQEREPAAPVRMRLEKDGTLRRIASRIRTDKTLSFLFEHAIKSVPEGEA